MEQSPTSERRDKPMRDLLTDPLSQPADLGKPIPDSRHAVSVCLPTWADNVGYEEGDPRVVERMQSGYPRFFYHPLCRDLFAECRKRFARPGEDCLVFASSRAAERFAEFLLRHSGYAGRLQPLNADDGQAVLFPAQAAATAKLGWQHLGGGVSSRQAECLLEHRSPAAAVEAKAVLRQRIAALADVAPDDVYLFPCGMNAVFAVHGALQQLRPEARSAQYGFPYVDTLKILQKVGRGAHFFPRGDDGEFAQLQELLPAESIVGLFTEFPSNPLLVCPDLERLDNLSRQYGFPLIVDDTIAGFHNVDLLPAADVVVSSLTKFFSGAGDVTGGSVIFNRNRPFYSELKTAFERGYRDALFAEDAIVLERNSRDYAARMPRINDSTLKLVDDLAGRPEVESVFFPQRSDVARYDRFRKPDGGYSGLFSLVLKDGPQKAPRFFERLRISKGPNLGTNFSLACPFTILAHYTELDFAESCGVSRWLVRVSVGLEPAEELIDRFAEALA
jgi:cystathionine gamma-synthase